MRTYTILQLSDLHLGRASDAHRKNEPRDALVRALHLIRTSVPPPDLIIFTGDIADRGDPACYQELKELVSTSIPTNSTHILYLPGNHDDPAAFRSCLLGWPPDDSPINQTLLCDGLRVIALDSTVPTEDYGMLELPTLEMLTAALATPAPDGTIIALHHPPLSSPWLALSTIALRNTDAFADVVRGSDVRLILCGHNHHESSGLMATIPIWSAPALAYRNYFDRDLVTPAPFPASAISYIALFPTSYTVSVLQL